MHKLVITVFKTLAFSIILMFLMDAAASVIDAYSVYMKLSNVGNLMQNEVARHNGLPEGDMADTFAKLIIDIGEHSRMVNGVGCNFESDEDSTELEVKFNSGPYWGYDCLTDSIKDYGQMCDITLRARMNLVAYAFPDRGKVSEIRKEAGIQTTMILNYKVPCLRYLK